MVNKITNKKYKDNVGEGLYNEIDGNGFILSAGVGNKMYISLFFLSFFLFYIYYYCFV